MRKTRILVIVVSVVFAVVSAFSFAAEGSDPLEGIQIIPPDPTLPDEIKFFSGYWEGTWIGVVRADYRTTAKLIVSEVSKEGVVATTANDYVIQRDREKAKIKRRDDGRLYIEFPIIPTGTLTYIAYPERGELKGVSIGRYAGLQESQAVMKRKQPE